ncbi:MAG TPA: hypothetical protein VM600_06260 [Actinomycetota bacterium]|nr:hypothetical protein [Actinomycetota bacterium]
MKRLLLALCAVVALAPAGARADDVVLLEVADGEFFYDATNDGVCNPATNTAAGAQAARHWHVGVPFAPAAAEPAGGFGCLGGPKTFAVTVAAGTTATVSGTVKYTWDTNVPGGCCNDVHIHVFDASGSLVVSTVQTDGLKPVIPVVEQVRSHPIAFTLKPGSYTIVEDIFSGEHSAWLTNLKVTAPAA